MLVALIPIQNKTDAMTTASSPHLFGLDGDLRGVFDVFVLNIQAAGTELSHHAYVCDQIGQCASLYSALKNPTVLRHVPNGCWSIMLLHGRLDLDIKYNATAYG